MPKTFTERKLQSRQGDAFIIILLYFGWLPKLLSDNIVYARAQNLKRKAEERNPDEFYFAMEKARTKGGVHWHIVVTSQTCCATPPATHQHGQGS